MARSAVARRFPDPAPRDDPMSFRDWMREVDRLCLSAFGMSIHDLPDMLFRDAYDSGSSPKQFMDDELPDLEAVAHHMFG